MRLAIAVFCGLALAASASAAFAQKSPAAPPAPGFEYLGTFQVQTGTRTVVENGPQGTRTIVQINSGRFEGPRLKATVQTPAHRRRRADSRDLQRHRSDNASRRIAAGGAVV